MSTPEPAGGQDLRPVGVEVAQVIDAALTGPVLVIGSPPPGGRDLDLLARPDDCALIARRLSEAGFERWRDTWARFDAPFPYAVELSSTARWATSRADASSLLDDAEEMVGFRHLRTPSPATVLLLAARGNVTRRGRLTAKARGRVTEALERDPHAWEIAQEKARDLGLVGSVRLLRTSYEASGPLSASSRAAGLVGVMSHGGPLRAKASIFLGARPRRVRPAIISFSGLDGSGKSTQVSQLQLRLGELGIVSEVQWAGFRIAKRWHTAVNLPAWTGEPERPSRDPIYPGALAGSRIGRHAWVLALVGINTAHLWRLVLRRRTGSDVLIFDRFSPDSMVKLDLHFSRFRDMDIRWQRRLFALISPKPDVGFLVEVSSGVAYGRRQEQTPQELALMGELYADHAARFRLLRLDGTRAPDPLGGDILAAAWRGLQ